MVPEVILLAAALLVGAPGAAAAAEQVRVLECAPAADGSGADADGDGLSDRCEFALASTFAPLLLARSGGCNWVRDPAPGRLGGGYLHAVAPAGDRVRVAYLPAYFMDCGWHDRRCILLFVNCAPHEGDSEFVVVELEAAANRAAWTVSGVFLSAHCFGRNSGSCRWYRGKDLNQFRWQGPAPVIWVAEGRNANYPSWQTCNAGHRTMDNCARHDASYEFPVWAGGNLGSRALPNWSDGCLAGHAVPGTAADPGQVECFWHPEAPFRGWQPAGRGVTPYERYLREVAGF